MQRSFAIKIVDVVSNRVENGASRKRIEGLFVCNGKNNQLEVMVFKHQNNVIANALEDIQSFKVMNLRKNNFRKVDLTENQDFAVWHPSLESTIFFFKLKEDYVILVNQKFLRFYI